MCPSGTHQCPPGRGLIPYYAVFFDFDTIRVLVKHENSVTTVPEIASGEIPHRGQHMCECFSSKLEHLIGTKYDLVFLYSTINETFQRHLPPCHFVMFGCENDSSVDLPPPARSEFRWVPLQEDHKDNEEVYGEIYDGLDGPHDYAWQVAKRSFGGEIKEDGVRPWETASWLWGTRRRIGPVLKHQGYTVTGPYEQHQISPTSAVLRLPTNRGYLYLKASHKREGLTMKSVSKFASFLVPSPLYVNVEDELMVMNDYGPTLADKFSKRDYKAILKLHAKLQLASIEHIGELTEIGLPRIEFESLKSRTVNLLEDAEVDKALRNVSGVTELKPYREALYRLLRRLYVDLDLPRTIVHGDIYDDNIIKTGQEDMEYVLYDWGSARIDIPFTDVMDLHTEVCDEDDSTLGMEPYLELWGQYGSVEHLKRVCADLRTKQNILSLLQCYEYAKAKRLHPPLEDENNRNLWNTLAVLDAT